MADPADCGRLWELKISSPSLPFNTVERQLHDVSKAYEAQSQTCKTQEATLQKLRSEMQHFYTQSEALKAEIIRRFEALKPQESETVD